MPEIIGYEDGAYFYDITIQEVYISAETAMLSFYPNLFQIRY